MAKRRRGSGEGTIYQRTSDGLWVGQLTAGRDEDGRLIRRTVYGRTQAAALEKLDELRGLARTGLLPDRASAVTTAQYLEHWLETSVKLDNSSNTHRLYSRMIRRHVLPLLGGVRLQRLRRHQIESLFARLAQQPRGGKGKKATEPLSGRTRRILFNAFRKALRDAVAIKLIVHNPMVGMTAPREHHRAPTFLERDELLRFLDAAKGDHYEVFYIVAVTTGLRLGELCGLRWRDVDFGRAQLRVEQQFDDRARKLTRLKTDHSRRTIPLPEVTLSALRAHRDQIGAIPHADRLVFLSPEGSPIRASNLRRRSFRSILKRAGLSEKGLRLHDLRHTMATLLADQGAPLTAIQGRLGHGSVAVTAKVYTHLSDRGARAAASLLDDALGSG